MLLRVGQDVLDKFTKDILELRTMIKIKLTLRLYASWIEDAAGMDLRAFV